MIDEGAGEVPVVFLMHFSRYLVCILMAIDCGLAQASTASVQMQSQLGVASTVMPGKNGLAIEFLGRAGLYSLNYDRALGSHVAMGLGFSYMDLGLLGVTGSVYLLPVYVNVYTHQGEHRGFISGGLTLISGKIESDNGIDLDAEEFSLKIALNDIANATIPLPMLGVGYEYRGVQGVLLRLSPYFSWFGKPIFWGGVSLGANF